MKRDVDDSTLKAMILDWLLRNKRIGQKYMSTKTLERCISHKIKRNGVRLRKLIVELIKEGYLITKKQGDVISIRYSTLKQANEYRKIHLY